MGPSQSHRISSIDETGWLAKSRLPSKLAKANKAEKIRRWLMAITRRSRPKMQLELNMNRLTWPKMRAPVGQQMELNVKVGSAHL